MENETKNVSAHKINLQCSQCNADLTTKLKKLECIIVICNNCDNVQLMTKQVLKMQKDVKNDTRIYKK